MKIKREESGMPMTNQPKVTHTPMPWKVELPVKSTYPNTHTVYISLTDSNGNRIAAVSVYGKAITQKQKYRMELGEKRLVPNLTDEEADANAAFIVRAVNAHEELLAALQEIGEACGTAFDDVSDMTSAGRAARKIFESMGKRAAQAIAKAEGK